MDLGYESQEHELHLNRTMGIVELTPLQIPLQFPFHFVALFSKADEL
jgi:hypothetical protein